MTTTTKSQDPEHPDWTSLPVEVLELILSNFEIQNFKDVDNFRAVCKSWQFIQHANDHVIRFGSQWRIGFGSQWLATKIGNGSTVKLFHPLSSESYNMDIPELRGATIRFSKDGWLLMSRGHRKLYFFHLFNKSKIKLPNLPENYVFHGITFTSNPTAGDCVVFGIATYMHRYVYICTISHGQKLWSATSIYEDFCLYKNPVYHKGKFYITCKNGKLRVFDPNCNGWTMMYQERPQYLCEDYLLDLNGDLVSVFVAYGGRGCISIFKWDESASNWISVHDLGEHMLFLSQTTSFAKKSSRDCMKNKIYFSRFHKNYGVFYDTIDFQYKTFGDNFSERNLDATEVQLECAWFEPTKEIGSKLVDWFGNSMFDTIAEGHA